MNRKGQNKNDITRDKHFGHLKTYKVLAIILVPLFLVYLLLEKKFDIEIDVFQKALLIYVAVLLLIFYIFSRVEIFRKNFLFAHYSFLSGVMLINLVWYASDPGVIQSTSLVLSANLIGIGIMNPKVTLGFFVAVLLSYVGIELGNTRFGIELALMLLVTASVVTGVNFWRERIVKELQSSRKTFKGIFDYADQQIYVLSKDFVILDLSKAAEEYLKEHGLTNVENKLFNEVFVLETDECKENFNSGIEKCEKEGRASFLTNCSVVGNGEFIPKEFHLRKGRYFNWEVYILNVRIVKEQKDYERELLKHKDSVTQILENINHFVFNISYDLKEKDKHQVNFVSSKVEEVFGYSVDEYITLVKSDRLDKDKHPDDLVELKAKREALFQKGGKDSWRFRMKVNGEWRWIEEKVSVEKIPGSTRISLFGMVKDVTDEILAEKLLKDSERRYRQIFETNLAGVYKTNLDGDLLDCNPAFAKILGYDSAEELKKVKIHNIYFNEKDREAYIKELKEKKQLNNYQLQLKRKDGRTLLVTNNVSIQKDETGEENTIIGTLVDLTELHETSLALKHSEEKYRLLFEESNNAILLVMFSEDGRFVVDTNQMATELFGLDENYLVGKELSDLLSDPEDLMDDFLEIEKALAKNKRVEKEWVFKNKENNKFYAEVSFASIMMDEDNVVQLVIKDISDRKQYEKEILESRLSFKNIVDKSPASILIFSESGELEYVNPNGENLFLNVLNSKERNLYKVFPDNKHHLIDDLIKEAENDINSYTEIELGTGDNIKRYSINVVNTVYNFEKANLFMLQDITLQTEYNIQKLRAEMAEEANISLQEEIRRHKRTQLSLLESTSRLKALFESSGHLYIISIDRDFNLVAYNYNFVDMVKEFLGIDVEMGMNFMDIFPIEDYAYGIIIERFNQVLAGEPSNLISRFQSKKGEVWMESFMSPIQIEGQEVTEISFISHNITEQVENRRKILESEENNRALLLAIPDILFKANNEGYFTDYRASSELERKAFLRFTKTEEIKDHKIEDVLIDQTVAQEIKRNVLQALNEDKLITHNFTVETEGEESEKVHYENRYSKVNDDEVVIISRNVTSTVEYEEKLIESVKEKEVLLKEVHHRVKNNLQVINSILNLQSSYVKDDETLQIIIESQNRIRSMSYIHESLYQTKDFSSIDFQDYITNLVQNLVHSYEVYSDKTELDLKVDSVALALDQAIPCGLILNELITNALKYAYPDQTRGKITIEVYEKAKKVYIRVQDFGVGLPKDFDISQTDSLGLSLVDTLIDQLDGELQLKTESGTEFLIIFDKQDI
ncbi:MAG: PAS domain S-box protein [Crocinitomicaceae bacterium]|nr:PAS domain S-box protein [Crocinitomicaceae bacterium]